MMMSSFGSSSRSLRNVSSPLVAPMRMSITTRFGTLLGDHADGFLAVGRVHHLQRIAGEVAVKRAANIRFVIDDQNLVHGGAS